MEERIDLNDWSDPAPVFVAPTLEFFEGEPDDDNLLHYRNQLEFRKLTPEYFVWLSRCFRRYKHSETFSQASIEFQLDINSKFEIVSQLALERYTPDTLTTAKPIKMVVPVSHLLQPSYQSQVVSIPPKAQPQPLEPTEIGFCFPADGQFRFHEKVTQASVEVVNAIREQAISLSWSESQLYQNRSNIIFPCGPEWGLVCFLHDDKQIQEVTSKYIALLNRGGQITRFFNHPINLVTGEKT